MKKFLLGTTAVLGVLAAMPAEVSAHANPTPTMAVPALTISGQAAFNVWFHNNNEENRQSDLTDPATNQKYGRHNLMTMDDARIKMSVDGKTDPGMEYGLITVFDTDTNAEKNVRELYMYFGGSWGTMYLGDAYGVEDTMAFGGFDPLVATGGFDGNFDRVVNFTFNTVRSVDLNGTTKRSTKATYITPRWRGLQAGISFTPKSGHKGSAKASSIVSAESPVMPFTRNNIALGANFTHKFNNGFEMALSGTAVFGKGQPPYSNAYGVGVDAKNTASFAFGTLLSWKGIEFGAEYGNNGKGGLPETGLPNGTDMGQFLDFGLGYTWGATKMSAGYFYGWRDAAISAVATDKSKTHIFTAGVEHKLAPGLAVYGEYAHYNMKNPGAAYEGMVANNVLSGVNQGIAVVPDNKANAFVLGTKIKF